MVFFVFLSFGFFGCFVFFFFFQKMDTKTEKSPEKLWTLLPTTHPQSQPSCVTCKHLGRSSWSLSWVLGEGKKTFLPGQVDSRLLCPLLRNLFFCTFWPSYNQPWLRDLTQIINDSSQFSATHLVIHRVIDPPSQFVNNSVTYNRLCGEGFCFVNCGYPNQPWHWLFNWIGYVFPGNNAGVHYLCTNWGPGMKYKWQRR